MMMKNFTTSLRKCAVAVLALSMTCGMTYAQREETLTLNSGTDFVTAYTALQNPETITKLTVVNKAADGGAALDGTAFTVLGSMAALQELDLSQDEVTTALPNNSFQNNKTIATVQLPVNLTAIGSGSFNSSVITTITIPVGVTDNDGIKGRFSNCQQLTAIEFSGENPTYFSHEGVVYKWNDGSKTTSTLVLYPCGKIDETYTMVAGCTEVGGDSFFYNNKLKKVVLSSEMQNITKDGAWRNITALKAFEVPADNAYYFTVANGILGEYARDGKSSYLAFCPPAYDAESIIIDGALADSVGGNADIRHTTNSRGYFFGGVASLKKIEFTEGFKYVGNLAVRNAPEGSNGVLEEIYLPSTLTNVGNDAFCQRNQVKTVVIRATVPPACGNNAFFQVNPTNLYVPAASVEAYQSAGLGGLGVGNIKPFYDITVTGGAAVSTIGNGIAAEGMEVTLTARPEEGQVFDHWETSIALNDANAAETTFTMGAEAVAITAVYKDASATSVETAETDAVLLYPNPAIDFIHISGMAGDIYTIYSTTGAVVAQGTLAGAPVSVAHLTAGIYVVKAGDKVARFIKED